MVKNKTFFLAVLFLSVIFFVSADFVVFEEESYIRSLTEKQGIENISNITKLDKSFLPDEIDVSNIEENQVGIYEIEYDDFGILRNIFVVSYISDEVVEVFREPVENSFYFTFNKNNLSFSSFVGSYVMLKSGSITGLSSFVSLSGNGKVFLYVYRNGESINFFNEISSGEVDTIDFDLQSVGLNEFDEGDILSLYIVLEGEVSIDEVSSILKVTE